MTNSLTIRLNFARVLNAMATQVHNLAIEKGWWSKPRSVQGLLGLVASECLGEAVEAIRKPSRSKKIGNFLNVEEEVSDTIIRVLDMAAHLEIDLGSWVTFPYGEAMGFSEFAARVYDEEVSFDDFAKHYEAFVAGVDLWSYVSDDFTVQHTKQIDDLDMLTGLIPKLAQCLSAIPGCGQPGLNSVLFESSLRSLTLRLIAIGQYKRWRIGEAIVAKHQYNHGRSARHGNKVY